MQRKPNMQNLITKCVKMTEPQAQYIQRVANNKVTHGRANFSMALEEVLALGIKAHEKKCKK